MTDQSRIDQTSGKSSRSPSQHRAEPDRPTKSVDERSALDFERFLLGSAKDEDRGSLLEERSKDDDEDKSLAGIAEAQLLLTSQRGPAAGNVAPVQSAPSLDKSLVETIEKLADRVLVSEPDSENSEVRIRLKPNVLEGAEISLRRDANGLAIKFETTSFSVGQKIDEFRGQLVEHMKMRVSEPVRVDVDVQHGDEGQGDPDGRSRNRFDPWDAYEQDDE